jgi:hypothetical protein
MGQMVFDNAPQALDADAVVLVPEPVSDAANVPPVNRGTEFRRKCVSFAAASLMMSSVLHGDDFLFIRNEAFTVQARREPLYPVYVV